MAAFFAALFLIYGVQIPFLPVWLDWRGLTAAEIGVITAAPFFVRLVVTPAIAYWADHTGDHRLMVVILSWLGLAAALVLSQMSGFWAILALALAFSLATSAVLPLTETVAIVGVRAEGLDYGRMRLWGSLSFIAATLIGGVIVARAGAAAGIWLLVAGAAATVVAAHRLPERAAEAATRVMPSAGWRSAYPVRLICSPLFLMFTIAAGATHGAHAGFYTLGAIHWQSQGLSGTTIGALWALGVISEVVLFAFSRPLVERFGAPTLIGAGALAGAVRWAAMSFDPALELLVPLQVLHALSYGAVHVGAIHFIRLAVPDAATGSAQAIYATVAAGVAQGVAGLIAGFLYKDWGAMFYVPMALMSLVGLAAAYRLHRTWDGRTISLAS